MDQRVGMFRQHPVVTSGSFELAPLGEIFQNELDRSCQSTTAMLSGVNATSGRAFSTHSPWNGIARWLSSPVPNQKRSANHLSQQGRADAHLDETSKTDIVLAELMLDRELLQGIIRWRWQANGTFQVLQGIE